jgi:hypothetical protein
VDTLERNTENYGFTCLGSLAGEATSKVNPICGRAVQGAIVTILAPYMVINQCKMQLFKHESVLQTTEKSSWTNFS